MGLKIKFRDRTLSSMVVHTLRTRLPGFIVLEVLKDGNNIVIVHPVDKTKVVITVKDNDLSVLPLTFKYNYTVVFCVFFLLVLPVTVAGYSFLSLPLLGIIYGLPFGFLLTFIFVKTYKIQYAKFKNHLKFHRAVEDVINFAFAGAAAPPDPILPVVQKDNAEEEVEN